MKGKMYLLLLGTTALSLVGFTDLEITLWRFIVCFSLSLSWLQACNINNSKLLMQVTTPLMFKLIPYVMNLGVLLQWFPSESSSTNEVSLSIFMEIHYSHICMHIALHIDMSDHWQSLNYQPSPLAYRLLSEQIWTLHGKWASFQICNGIMTLIYSFVYRSPHATSQARNHIKRAVFETC